MFQSISWTKRREDIISFIAPQLEGKVLVEIGTDGGAFANFLLSNTVNTKLYCIDPYQKYDDYKDAINNVTGDALYQATYTKLKQSFGDRVHFIRKFSSDAAQDIEEEIDFLYIDGNHQYNYVIQDLQHFFPKVKAGGIIIGDDAVDVHEEKRDADGNEYIEWCPGCFGWYGVKKAFEDFLSTQEVKEGILINTQYCVKK
jgi:predicted O-methyltransferase YrrM